MNSWKVYLTLLPDPLEYQMLFEESELELLQLLVSLLLLVIMTLLPLLVVLVVTIQLLLPLFTDALSSEVFLALFLLSLKGSLLMMNSSKKFSWVPRKGMKRSTIKLLLLLLLEFPVHESPLIHEYLPLDTEPAESIDVFDEGHDLRVSQPKLLLDKLLFSF